MADITPSMIKELRERTGVGMGKCKEALEEAKGDMELAIANLRKAGIASAVKKQGREAKEGQIAIAENDKCIAFVEVNAETDFVVKNDRFQRFITTIAKEAADTQPASVEAFLTQKFSKDKSMSIEEFRAIEVQAIGENIQIKRIRILPKGANKSVGYYSHMGGKIVCAVEISGANGEEALAKEISMHSAAASPEYLSPEQVPSEILTQEKEIAKAQLSGKPAHIMDKIIEGKLNAYYDGVCLTRQKYIKDDSITITDLVQRRAKEIGKPLTLTAFLRWAVGQ